jgi:hypothetical protein
VLVRRSAGDPAAAPTPLARARADRHAPGLGAPEKMTHTARHTPAAGMATLALLAGVVGAWGVPGVRPAALGAQAPRRAPQAMARAAALPTPRAVADSLWAAGDARAAESAYAAVLARDPDDARATFRLAQLRERRDPATAERLYRATRRWCPTIRGGSSRSPTAWRAATTCAVRSPRPTGPRGSPRGSATWRSRARACWPRPGAPTR